MTPGAVRRRRTAGVRSEDPPARSRGFSEFSGPLPFPA
ncbi:hypothetical protein B4135_0777 [Caldibacillus debilis]|uniref:Uncharacterized protein n=1 Tax=Caldibacillus debilis TaxID=301148 RepID=A0A150M5S7_9BACI|nr:hypothetical protein B4135_0777 [Caldibacillus debilis]